MMWLEMCMLSHFASLEVTLGPTGLLNFPIVNDFCVLLVVTLKHSSQCAATSLKYLSQMGLNLIHYFLPGMPQLLKNILSHYLTTSRKSSLISGIFIVCLLKQLYTIRFLDLVCLIFF